MASTSYIIFCLGRAVRIRAVPSLALAGSITLFGFLCVIPIALVRAYLGNWHIQYVLPAVVGAYAIAAILWHQDRTRWSLAPLLMLSGLLSSRVYGYARGFSFYGPEYAQYIASIEPHAFRFLAHADQVPPYPAQHPDKDLDPRLILFLAAYEHPLFARHPVGEHAIPLPTETEILIGGILFEAAAPALATRRDPPLDRGTPAAPYRCHRRITATRRYSDPTLEYRSAPCPRPLSGRA